MTSTGRGLSPQAKRTRLAVLATGWVMMIAGAGAGILSGGPLDWETILVVSLVIGFVSLLVVAGAVAIVRDWTPRQMPAGYEKRPVERFQWSRGYSSLILYPLLITNFSIMATSGVDEWVRKDRDPYHLIMLGVLPVLCVLFVCALSPFPRGKPGSRERKFYERMNDELSATHMGVAFRYGFFAAMVGLIGVLVTALFAPKGVLFALIGAFWLATVTTLVRFGLLQRAAEPQTDED